MEKSKFEGYKPLIQWKKYKNDKFLLKFSTDKNQKTSDLIDFVMSTPMDNDKSTYIFDIKVNPVEFINYDFLPTYDGPVFIIHDRVLKIFQEICPNDFQRFDMVIKNLDPKDPPFENHDFHIINVTHRIKALDMERSEFHKSPNGILFPTKRVFKDEDCWEGHLLAREHLESSILFHPRLAKKFRRSKGIQFLSDSEAPC